MTTPNSDGAAGEPLPGFGDSYRDRMRDAQAGRPVRTAATVDVPDEEQTTVQRARSLWNRISSIEWVDHVFRAAQRYSNRLGNQFAAAITYFSFLSMVPLLMVSFSVVAFAVSPQMLDDLKGRLYEQIPSETFSDVIDKAVDSRLAVGLVGLVVALYSGVNWMSNVRDAVQAQWRPRFVKSEAEKSTKFYVRYGKDVLALVGLGIALLASIALTTIGGAGQDMVLGWLGLDDVVWVTRLFSVVPFCLAVAADVMIFTWFYRMLERVPDYTPAPRAVVKGAAIAAVGFEGLKVALTFILPQVTSSPTAAVFGPVIGLLFFFNLAARLVLFVAAWIGTAPAVEMPEQKLPQIPGPTLLVHDDGGVRRKVGMVGAGVVAGVLAGRGRRR